MHFTSFSILLFLSVHFTAVASFPLNNKYKRNACSHLKPSHNIVLLYNNGNEHAAEDIKAEESKPYFSNQHVTWRITPWLNNEGKFRSAVKMLSHKINTNVLRLSLRARNKKPPPIVLPNGGKAVLEALVNQEGILGVLPLKKVARFGITTQRGPPSDEITSTLRDIYNLNYDEAENAGCGAIIYMYADPKYRSLGLGELALNIIASIQSMQQCDYTVLVADDDGSGKLISWYKMNGFVEAPELQEIMGSPESIYGVTMIRPTSSSPDILQNARIIWW